MSAGRIIIKGIGTLFALGFLAGGLFDWYAKKAFDWHAGLASTAAVLIGCSLIDSPYTESALKPIRKVWAMARDFVSRTPPSSGGAT